MHMNNVRLGKQKRPVLNQLRREASLWESLFYNFAVDTEMSISSRTETGRLRTFSATSLDVNSLLPDKPVEDTEPQINFSWFDSDGFSTANILDHLDKDDVSNNAILRSGTRVSIFSSSIPEDSEDVASEFSRLSKSNQDELILASLRKEFPIILGLSIQMEASGAAVFARVAGVSNKIPLGMVSDGVSKLLHLLLGIASHPGGVVLIDQIEDGFYFERLPSVWRLIVESATTHGVQLFITTHSKEALEALLPTIQKNENEFSLLRTYQEEAQTQVENVKGAFLASALAQHFEVR